MSVTTYTHADLTKRYESFTHKVTAECELITELVGGMNADYDPGTQVCQLHLWRKKP